MDANTKLKYLEKKLNSKLENYNIDLKDLKKIFTSLDIVLNERSSSVKYGNLSSHAHQIAEISKRMERSALACSVILKEIENIN